jgi:hypothetical protein
MTDTSLQLPPNSGGPLLDAENYTGTVGAVIRERVAFVAGTPSLGQTTIANSTFSSSGANVVVAAVASQTVRIYRLLLVVSSPTNVEFLDGGSTVLAGPFPLQTNGTIVLDDSGEPWFITSAGNAFEVNLSVSVTVCCTVWYTQS